MKRREARRQREREQLPRTLSALVQLVPAATDVRKYFEENYGSTVSVGFGATGHNEDGERDSVIEGDGLQKLLVALGESCPDGPMDIVRVARRVPRSQSTLESIQIAELCFAISQATGPVGVHERRRDVGAQMAPLDEETPLLQYYKGRRFRAIIHGEDPSSPAARAAVAAAVTGEEGREAGNVNNDDAETAKEWAAFVKSAGTALPMTLRVHNSEVALKQVALHTLLGGDKSMRDIVKPVAALPAAAMLFSCSNADYHANPTVEYTCRTLHAASAVSFQEVVSAIPVIALCVEPHHTVLDMCAAPGSKTLQALDGMLSRGWETADLRKGVLIANERDRVKATQTLPARLKRFHAPHVMSTRCDATQWPRLFVTEGGALAQYKDDENNCPIECRFDRIICDVPCSGDGTIRKEPSVAGTWSPGYVKSLVPTQKALLRRGLDLLEDDGILVYSTCSINPKEDEEVVCAGLEVFGDAVELLDVNAILAQKGASLHSAGGIASPNVEGLQNPVLPAGFDGRKLLRVLPHRDNTGGFFIAAFRKVKQLDWTQPTIIQSKLNLWTKGKLWAPVAQDDPVWTGIAAFYGFDHLDKSSFSYYPESCGGAEKNSQGLVPVYQLNPHGGPSRRIALATPALASMIFGTRPYKGPGVEVVCVGVRAFEAYDGRFLSHAACRWRAVVESASYLAPRFARRKLVLKAGPHRRLLEELLRNGSVYVREHWRSLLCEPEVCCAMNETSDGDDGFPFVKPGPLKDLLVRSRDAAKEKGTCLSSSPSPFPSEEDKLLGAKVADLLATELHVGGVLVALFRGDGSGGEKEEPWFVSATLSGNKLELAIDASLRTYGLMAYLDVLENASKPMNESGGSHVNHEVADAAPAVEDGGIGEGA